MAKLTALTTISLDSNEISEIKGLEKLTALKTLNLHDNQISEINGFEELTALNILNLHDNQVSEIKGLEYLTVLKKLSLHTNQISEIKNLDQLTALKELYLYSNQISEIKGLDHLTKLIRLSIYSNQISEIKGLDQLIALKELYLFSNQISEIKGLDQLTALKELYLYSNQISEIKGLEKLAVLTHLSLSSNEIGEIKGLEKLTALNNLYIKTNKISEIQGLEKLKFLRILDLKDNEIKDILKSQTYLKESNLEIVLSSHFNMQSGINLYGNPIKNPPIDVVQQGKAAVLRYFKELEKSGGDYLCEARLLIVGQGDAGKTSLKVKLLDVDNPLPKKGDTTRGIEIATLPFKTADGNDFDLRIWDFGGQNIQHYAHQFFLSDSSLYALVHNQRKENTNFRYWLNIIELLGKSSPVIIVLNEVDGHKGSLETFASIKARFANVESPVHHVNLEAAKTDDRFAVLKKQLEAIASNPDKLQHLSKLRPKSFIKVRNHIETLAQTKQYISWADYLAICADAKVAEEALMRDYSKTMTDLGICLHFEEDMELKDTVFLNPKWIIDALFALLYNEKVSTQNGEFCETDTSAIWKDAVYQGMHSKLVRLMENFELCYRIEGSEPRKYLVPQRLPSAGESFPWQESEVVKVMYRYKFIPSGILTRLTCRLHKNIEVRHVWNDAVIFTNKTTDARVFVRERYGENELWMDAAGIKRSELLNKVIEEIDNIHESSKFAKLKIDKLLPCNCRTCKDSTEKSWHKYENLVRRLGKGKPLDCLKNDDEVDIEKLLADTFEGGDKLFLQMRAIDKGMHGGFDRIEKRFDSLDNQLGEFKFLIENFSDDYKEATQLILNDLKNIQEDELGSAAENQQLLEKMLIAIEQNENYNAEQKAKVKQELNRSDIEIKHKLVFGIPDILGKWLPFKYQAEISASNKQKLPKTWKDLKALLLKSGESPNKNKNNEQHNLQQIKCNRPH